ncbi:MAG TPA: LuxR C-terminal-related transcriptional regulator [Ktedonobacteraceae bacterium]|nr:LuxR C-terminal-related transcriptional regulator [Ktedonobacteraceae bacterium]
MPRLLPPYPSHMLGRKREKEAILALLAERERLISFTGIGGIGKTTLAIAVAHEWAQSSSHPVWFCVLSSIHDPKHIPLAIAQTLGVQAKDHAEETIIEYLSRNPGLLILDNFEHLISSAPFLSFLLGSCPALQLIVTSREILQLREERCFEVSFLNNTSAVALFQKHATRVLPQFQLSDENRLIVTEICRHLDGIPLAIELAAARLLLFSPEELLNGLANRFSLLSSNRRDLPVRQQTLYNTLAWSYDLLSSQEQFFFRLFSVFVGGVTVQMIEVMCKYLEMRNPLDCLAGLFNKYLILRVQDGNTSRFTMLETIREYALELLKKGSKEEEIRIRDAHARTFLYFLESMQHVSQSIWLARLDSEAGNLQAAVDWWLAGAVHQHHYLGSLIKMVCSLANYWEIRGVNQDAFGKIMRLLALSEQADVIFDIAPLAEIYILASKFALVLGNLDEALALAQEASHLLPQKQLPRLEARAFLQMGNVEAQRHHFVTAENYLTQGIKLLRSVLQPNDAKEQEELGHALFVLADVLADRGEEYERPQQLLAESIHIFQMQKNQAMWGRARHHLSVLYFYHRRLPEAIDLGEQCLAEVIALSYRMPQAYLSTWLAAFFLMQPLPQINIPRVTALLSESLQLFEQIKNRHGISWTLINRARLFWLLEQSDAARKDYNASLEIAQAINDFFLICRSLEGLAEVTLLSSPEEALCFLAEATTIRIIIGMKLQPIFLQQQEQIREQLHAIYPDLEHSPAWLQGQQLAHALLPDFSQQGQEEGHEKTNKLQLTAREKEILTLVALGDQNKEIARKLQVSSRTVNAHLQSIYQKLKVNTRAAATRIFLLQSHGSSDEETG